MSLENRLKFGPFLTVYNKDYIKKKPQSQERPVIRQEFEDPVCEGFKHYLVLDKNVPTKPPSELVDDYMQKVKVEKPDVFKMYFQKPVDEVTIKGEKLLNGKSVYQVNYCDIEGDIKKKLEETAKESYSLPEGWDIPLTTQKYEFRPPLVLNKYAMDKPLVVIPPNNLGQNEKVNEILQVKTGDSEYNHVIGKLGAFIVEEEMHGKIDHPQCGCLQH